MSTSTNLYCILQTPQDKGLLRPETPLRNSRQVNVFFTRVAEHLASERRESMMSTGPFTLHSEML